MTRKLLFGCTLLLIPVLCLSVRIPSTDLTSPKMLLGYVLFGLIIALQFFHRTHTHKPRLGQLPDTWTMTVSTLPWLVMMIAWAALSRDVPQTRELIRIFPGVALAMCFWMDGVSSREQLMIFRAIAVCGFIAAALGIGQFAGLDPIGWQYSFKEGVFSLMGHPNMLAPLLVAALAFQVTLGRTAIHKPSRWVWWSLIPGTVGCLVLTFSKGAWLGALVAMVTLIPFKPRHRIALVLVVLLVAGASLFAVKAEVPGRLMSDNALRPAIWQSSLKMLDSPSDWIIGHGPGRWFIQFPSHRDPQFLPRFRRTENIRHAHNELLEQLCETGILGVMLFACIWLTFLRLVYNRLKNRSLTPLEKAATYSLSAIFIHSLVSVNLRTYSVWTLFWIIAAFALEKRSSEKPRHIDSLLTRKKPVLLVSMLFFLLSIYLTGAGLMTSYAYIKSTDLQYQGQVRMGDPDKSQAVEYLADAVAADGFNLDARYDLAVTLYEMRRFKESEEAFDAIAEIAPDFQRIHMNYAVLYLDWGQQSSQKVILQKGLQSIKRELEINDMDENYYLQGALQMANGQTEAATGSFNLFLERMDRNRKEMEFMNRMRADDNMPLVTPKNWDSLLEMEKAVRVLVNR